MFSRYYQVAGITIKVNSDLEITDTTFAPKFKLFEIKVPGDDVVVINHHFGLPEFNTNNAGKIVYSKPPWIIYEKEHEYTYILQTSPDPEDDRINQIMFCNNDYSEITIYNNDVYTEGFKKGNKGALTLNPTDQIFLSEVLSRRDGCYFHSDGMIIDGNGYLFIGHSGAGKSTIAMMLQDNGEILCDDRMIVRKKNENFKIYGNWSHGTLPIVSASSSLLKAIFFLNQSKTNHIEPIYKSMDKIKILIACMVKPLNSNKWWDSSLNLIEEIANEIPCYNLFFNKNGLIYKKIVSLKP
ncbi:MAG: hypothetical protein GY699_17910 [Desulfobacteraceae bacterium]|nr:hypothetical protein [Desulfobacteraceae bacterium]